MSIFKPDLILNRYDELDIDRLKSNGFNTIIIDIDNALDLPDSLKPASIEVYDFLDRLKDKGFNVCVVSNNTKKRVLAFVDNRDLDYYYWSFKPFPFIYKKIIKKYKIKKNELVTMGDQILTDCLGANMYGLYSIYTKPLYTKDSITTVVNRKIERFIFKHILHEKM